MSKLTDFYKCEATDTEGRTFEEIIGWTDFFWEGTHDHIQWCFPTKRPSSFSEDAPVLTEEDITEWKTNSDLRWNLRVAYLRWLKFLGLEEDDGQVRFVEDLKPFQQATWTQYNHNFRRTTRVLDSLMTLGLEKEAKSFYQFLESQYNENKVITDNTFEFWTAVMDR